MIGEKNVDCQEMFRHACTFCECADLALNKFQHDTADIGWYVTPATVNSAFACEVFMKAILKHQEVKIPKSHKLRELYDVLPQELQKWIKQAVSGGFRNIWTNVWGQDYLDEISNAFVEWRYSYEHDLSKSGTMRINIGFLKSFRDALREVCCTVVFGMTWNEYEGSYNG